MKKTILLFALTAMAVAANAQNDTLTVIRPDSVSIVRNDGNVDLKIFGNGDNSNYRYSMNFDVNNSEPMLLKENKAPKKEFDMSLPLFKNNTSGSDRGYVEASIGLALLLGGNIVSGAPKELDIDPFRSIDIWCPNLAKITWHLPKTRFSFSLNYGLEWRNYRMVDKYRFFIDDNKVVGFAPYESGITPKFSRIKVISNTLALTARYKFFRECYFRFGSVISFNDGLSVKTKYKDANGRNITEKQNRPRVNRVSLEWVGSFQLHDFGIWMKFSPKNVLRESYGPQFSTTTVGVSIGW